MLKVEDVKEKKNLLLHCCCAPCSSYSFLYLCEKFNITAFFYNPNIMPKVEHDKRLAELKRLIKEIHGASTCALRFQKLWDLPNKPCIHGPPPKLKQKWYLDYRM